MYRNRTQVSTNSPSLLPCEGGEEGSVTERTRQVCLPPGLLLLSPLLSCDISQRVCELWGTGISFFIPPPPTSSPNAAESCQTYALPRSVLISLGGHASGNDFYTK